MKKEKRVEIPAEAARIMAKMARMPPKPHEEMKLGNARNKDKKKEKKPTD